MYVLYAPKENTSRASKQKQAEFGQFWSPEFRQFFYDREWVLFEMFPEYKTELKGIKVKTLQIT